MGGGEWHGGRKGRIGQWCKEEAETEVEKCKWREEGSQQCFADVDIESGQWNRQFMKTAEKLSVIKTLTASDKYIARYSPSPPWLEFKTGRDVVLNLDRCLCCLTKLPVVQRNRQAISCSPLVWFDRLSYERFTMFMPLWCSLIDSLQVSCLWIYYNLWYCLFKQFFAYLLLLTVIDCYCLIALLLTDLYLTNWHIHCPARRHD